MTPSDRPGEVDPERRTFYASVADEIVRSLAPRRVFHAGCAMGRLVEALWARGAAARGRASCPPLGGQIERHLGEVVGHHPARRDVDDRGHGDAPRVTGPPGEVRVGEPLDPEHGVLTAGVEVERPAAGVMGRSAHAHRQRALEPQQAADDDGPVGPGAGPRHHQAVTARCRREAVAPVPGDACGQVLPVADERLALPCLGATETLRGGCRHADRSLSRCAIWGSG